MLSLLQFFEIPVLLTLACTNPDRAESQSQSEAREDNGKRDFTIVVEEYNAATDRRDFSAMWRLATEARLIDPASPVGEVMESKAKPAIAAAIGRLFVLENVVRNRPDGRIIRLSQFDLDAQGNIQLLTHQSRINLQLQLDQAIRSLDELYGLSEPQKQKLQLAGRGDIHQISDRVTRLGIALTARVRDNAFKMEDAAIQQELIAIDRQFSAGLFRSGSKFDKAKQRVLTTEQKSLIR
jgi:hypothetical protein